MCAEFGLNPTAAVFPRDFYGKGGAPAAGVLGFQDFVGRSGVTFTPAPGRYSPGNGPGAAAWPASSNQPVTWTYTITGAGCTASQANGFVGTDITFNFTGTSTATVHLTATINGQSFDWTITGTGGA